MPRIFCLAATLAAVVALPGLADTPDTDGLEAEASALAAEFIAMLKPQLQQSLQAGGPTRAIEVCADQAPKIADGLSERSGWQVRRVSLQPRNASRAIPDAWERSVLKGFDRLLAGGEPPDALRHGEVVGSQFRYMQAQAVEGVCLLCHGENISREVKASLREYYPDDTATGYYAGQIRGAISLSRPL